MTTKKTLKSRLATREVKLVSGKWVPCDERFNHYTKSMLQELLDISREVQ